ncbi:MAG TPA: hypothetical protein VMV31_14220 [Terriglobales bacterium]|nr:hypothetical protein [Terriglobales bacterium]
MNKLYTSAKTKADIAALLEKAKALVEKFPAAPTPEAPDDYVNKVAAGLIGKQDARYAPAAAAGGVDIEAVKGAMQLLEPQDDQLAKAALAAAKASGDLDRPRRVFYI